MALFKTITQGGQVHIHQLHMLKQILVAGFVVAFIAGGGYFLWKSVNLPSSAWRVVSETYWARFMVDTNPSENHQRLTQLYTPPKGTPYKRSCLSILQDPLLKRTTQNMEKILEQIAYQSLKFAGWAFLLVMGFWFFFGRAQQQAHHQRGNTLVPWKKLATLIKRKDQASDLRLPSYVASDRLSQIKRWLVSTFRLRDKLMPQNLPLLKGKETSHILITGTTGSGKTNAFHTLLPQIRNRGDRAVVLDVTGDYVSRYYNEETDIILNPLDIRSTPWHPWTDCTLDSHYDVLAESFIQPKDHTKDPFWDNASRAVFKTALRKYAFQKNENIEELTTFLLSSSDKEFEDFFKNTEAATFAFKNNEKTTHSIRSVLSSQIEGLRQLDTPTTKAEKSTIPDLSNSPSEEQALDGTLGEAFSIRKWVMDQKPDMKKQVLEKTVLTPDPRLLTPGKGWLFITARADQRQTLTPLISAWMDLAMNALMVLPEDPERRLWFVIDELAALQRLPKLQAGLAEGRKYGGCLLVGFQSKPQLEEIYGRNTAEAMLDLFNTKLFFRCTEPSTQAWISKVLGEKEEAEPQESISFGAHSMRDGVSLARHTRQKPLVMPAELSQLEDLECYLKLPGDYPCTRFWTAYQPSPFTKKEAFILKPEKKRDYAMRQVSTQSPEVSEENKEELI